ncbi:hypothetical protein T05_4476 [Trichinella murrelli]|uniref:Uncharacterized protein n=1 Tax=Trichinella murrelli TaxID=144512 RepID=A0A0V0TE80_9BILA|nr:hypothetical protein T05_4476 [Trichinella murrelli]
MRLREHLTGLASPVWMAWRTTSARGPRLTWTTRPRTPSGLPPGLIDPCRSTPAHWGASSPLLPAPCGIPLLPGPRRGTSGMGCCPAASSDIPPLGPGCSCGTA